ncbi:hypothetical protein [Shewanella sp. Isolate11]|uniref:hypothetical protein n=1 Tax=Shewanella sp. Isolate11 TaxID=2908530 RepID=UPI001EFD4C81|nr:hypothetical protein [Shewanella sp. Isolate11]MCG9697247.1 hypothetical protein [Shewanella sp. Isolate11]
MQQNHSNELSDEQLKQLYKAQATEQPSQALDEAILAKAKQQQSNRTQPAAKGNLVFLRQYRWPISTAASAFLLVSLLLLNPNSVNEHNGIDGSLQGVQPQAARTLMAPQVNKQVQQTAMPEQKGTEPASETIATDTTATSIAEMQNQARATISDLQALNHLQQLTKAEDWAEANKLLQRINLQRPQLADPKHPQHQQWLELSKIIATHPLP